MKCPPLHTAIFLLCSAPFAIADIVTLKDGRVLEGQVLEDDGKVLKIKLKKGNMTLDRNDVVSVEEKPTPEEEYKDRLAKLDPNSASAQLELGRWAGGKELAEEAVRHLLAAYKIDPALNGVAAELTNLDYHLVKGRWCDPDTYYPSIGYTKFEGRWCSPAELSYRMALKEVSTLGTARDAAKTALAGGGGKIKKIETRMATEQASIDRITKLIAKAETDQAAAIERCSATEAKVKAASDKLTALQAKEKPKEGDPPKDSSPAMKAAEKNLATALVAAEKETKALTIAKKAFTDQTTEKAAAEARLKDIEKEKAAVESELATMEVAVKQAQAKLDDATASAEALKAAWEKDR